MFWPQSATSPLVSNQDVHRSASQTHTILFRHPRRRPVFHRRRLAPSRIKGRDQGRSSLDLRCTRWSHCEQHPLPIPCDLRLTVSHSNRPSSDHRPPANLLQPPQGRSFIRQELTRPEVQPPLKLSFLELQANHAFIRDEMSKVSPTGHFCVAREAAAEALCTFNRDDSTLLSRKFASSCCSRRSLGLWLEIWERGSSRERRTRSLCARLSEFAIQTSVTKHSRVL